MKESETLFSNSDKGFMLFQCLYYQRTYGKILRNKPFILLASQSSEQKHDDAFWALRSIYIMLSYLLIPKYCHFENGISSFSQTSVFLVQMRLYTPLFQQLELDSLFQHSVTTDWFINNPFESNNFPSVCRNLNPN